MKPEDQLAIATEIAARAPKSHIDQDAAGNVIRLGLSNAKNHEKNLADPSTKRGATDADLARLVEFPLLEAIYLERQHQITDAGYARLGQIESITDLRIHYPMEAATPNFPACVNALHHLRILELKHIFQVKAAPTLTLEPRPLLEKLELDTIWATPAQVDFICAATRVTNLQLHRTTITGEDLRRISESLPKLTTLELRPNGPKDKIVQPADLAALTDHPSLKNIFLSLDWKNLRFENGLEHLARIQTLAALSIDPKSAPALTPDSEDIKRFQQLRPDVTLQLGNSGGKGKPFPRADENYRWGICI